MGRDEILRVFTELFVADLHGDAERPLAEYQRLFPGHEDAIAEAHRRMRMPGASPAAAVPAPARDDGLRIGWFRLLGLLGRGGQGEVHRAEDTRLKRIVALKILPGRFASDVSRKLLQREAEIAARLDHPGICPVYEVGSADGTDYIAMKFVKGETLAQRISRWRNAARERRGASATGRILEAVTLMRKCALAADAAHRAMLVHRDIKPGNVMIGDDGEPVLLDFGLARLVDGDATLLAATQGTLGTPAYMAPEVVRGDQRIDRRADVYALGATLYECVTLERPHRAATREAMYRAILNDSVEDARHLEPATSRDLAAVLAVALEKDPERRYVDAARFAEDLRRVAAREPVEARAPGPIARVVRWAGRNPLVAGLDVAVLVLLISWLAFALASNRVLKREEAAALANAEQARTSLAQVERLADLKGIDQLERRVEQLVPIAPATIPEFERWLAAARGLVDRLPRHREELARLAETGAGPGAPAWQAAHAEQLADLAAREAEVETLEKFLAAHAADDRHVPGFVGAGERCAERRAELRAERESLERERTFPSTELAWRFGVSAELVRRLEAFADPEHGAVAEVTRRLAQARAVERTTSNENAPAWERAREELRSDPRFGGVDLVPQVGLVPIGKDPASGLQEFVHWLSNDGDPPRRRADGSIEFDARTGIILVLLPGGAFDMGTEPSVRPEERSSYSAESMMESPRHRVQLDPFFIAKFETTQAQFVRLAGSNPSKNPFDQPRGADLSPIHPVENVSYAQAAAVMKRCGLAIPTEAQWEYAARAGTTTLRFTGDDWRSLDGHVNARDKSSARLDGNESAEQRLLFDDGFGRTAPVDSLSANAFGLHHVLGNVEEWTCDCRAMYSLPVREGDGARIAVQSDWNIARGGGFLDLPDRLRCAARDPVKGGAAAATRGFRASRSLDR